MSSTVNFPLGDTRANNLTVPLAPNGKLAAVYKAQAGKTTHLIVDITGYFLPGDEDATYAPITPVRALDSRFGIGLAGTFADGVPRQLNITGLAAIPADATAITGNLTVVGQTRAGYISITKTEPPQPGDVDAQLPARRYTGERHLRAAQRGRRTVDRLQGVGRDDPRHPRCDWLLPRHARGAPLVPADPRPRHGHPTRRDPHGR